ncbi:MAG: DUF3307 domain-containing protein [Bdellovibrionales bacterium]|nr:DUF3307 domain-containing protein [Bdellovibrionales bacterium]
MGIATRWTPIELTFVLLVVYQIKHFLADFPLQREYMLHKTSPGWDFFVPLVVHCLVHGALTLVILWIFAPHLWWLTIVDIVVHFFMDRVKSGPRYLGRYHDKTKASFWNCLGIDQMVHHLTHFFIVWTIVTASSAGAQEHDHQHGDHHAAPASAEKSSTELKLNQGKKWPTDKALRQNMTAIQKLMNDSMAKIHEGQFADGDYLKLADQVDGNLKDIFKNCKLPVEADAQLHVILAEMTKQLMVLKKTGASPEQKHEAAMAIMDSHHSYETYFDGKATNDRAKK